MDTSDTEDVGTIYSQQKPETLKERTDRLSNGMKKAFDSIKIDTSKENTLCAEHLNLDRVVVDVLLVLDLFKKSCQHMSCCGTSKVLDHAINGGVLKVSWKCSEGHVGVWTSSKILCQKQGQDIYVNSLLLAAGVLISGNNFEKLSLFNKFVGLSFISKITFNRMQTHYIIPEVKQFWGKMKTSIWNILSGESTVLCGDGRNDSPGHSSKYCVYVLMEQFLEIIVDLEVVDKRETGGISTNMEVFGLKKLLERIVGELTMSEIVTDASPSVTALVRKMKGNFSLCNIHILTCTNLKCWKCVEILLFCIYTLPAQQTASLYLHDIFTITVKLSVLLCTALQC